MKRSIFFAILCGSLLTFGLFNSNPSLDQAKADPVTIRGAENFSSCTGNDIPDACKICPDETGYSVDNLPGWR